MLVLRSLSRIGLRAASLFLLLAVAACGSSAQPSHIPDPRQLALQPRDFSNGFSEVTHRYWTSAQLAKRTGTPRSLYDQHGLVRAYQSSFLRLTHVGLARVSDLVYQFRDQSGAQWFLTRLQDDARTRGYHPFHFNVALGDQLYAYSFHPKFNSLVGTEYVVYYRRQATVASFVAAGQDNPMTSSAEVVPFVGSVDLRAKAAYRT